MRTQKHKKHLLSLFLSALIVFQSVAGILPVADVKAADNILHCINPWGGSYMQVTHGGSTVSHPQIIYGNDSVGASRAMFCIDLGASLESGDSYAILDESSYAELNENQKRAIAYATGNGAVTQPYAGSNGFADAAVDAAAQNTLMDYWSTQLMIWYFINQYDTGSGKTGITWDDVTATCSAGWGDLTECNRIWTYVHNMMNKPAFSEWYNGGSTATTSYPQIKLEYDAASGTYIGWGKETDEYFNIVDGNYYVENVSVNNALSFTVTDDDGRADDTGHWLKITSTIPIAESTNTIVWGKKVGTQGICDYAINATHPQDLVETHATFAANPDYFGFRIYTEGGTGEFSMKKTGVGSGYVSGNGNYTLAGAVYAVDALNGSGSIRVAELTTDADGTAHVTMNSYDPANVGMAVSSDSHTVVTKLPYGNYTVKEIHAPSGYSLDPTVYLFTVNSLNTGIRQTWTSNEKPVIPALSMKKVSTNPEATQENPCYSLAGAVYQVYSDPSCTIKATALIVDGGGTITGTTDAVLVTTSGGSSNTLHLPAGRYYVKEITSGKGFRLDTEIHAVDLTAVAGSTQTFESREVPVLDPLNIEIYKTDAEGITMVKEGSGKPTVIGGATLSGAIFRVDHYPDYYDADTVGTAEPDRTWYIKTKYDEITGKYIARLDADHLASGYSSDEFYFYSGGSEAFPLGTVTIQEVQAPPGYSAANGDGGVMTDAAGVVESGICIMQIRPDREINPNTAHRYVASPTDSQFTLNAAGQSIKVFTTVQTKGLTVSNVLARGDISMIKNDYETGEGMEGVFFRITSSTGESHIIRTGSNGFYSSDAVSHSAGTNAYDTLFDAAGNWIGDDMEDLPAECGLWFYGTDDQKEWDADLIDDARGAFRYDEAYTIEELPCPANEGKQLMQPKTFSITEEGKNVFVGTLDNVPVPRLHTLEWDAETNDHLSVADDNIQIKDTVFYEYLTKDTTYTVKGILMEMKEDGSVQPLLDDDGNYIRANQIFRTEDLEPWNAVSGSVDVTFSFSGNSLSGKQFVIFEYLFAGEDNELIPVLDNEIDNHGVMEYRGTKIQHANPEDEGQQGYFPAIHTMLTDAGSSKLAIVPDSGDVVLVDSVSYTGLTVGKEYELSGTLMNRLTGKAVEVNGKAVTASVVFVAEQDAGSVDVTFTFDPKEAGLLQDDGSYPKLVCFEELIYATDSKKITIAEHKDIEDEGQTVTLRNKKRSVELTKVDENGHPLSGVEFALYRQEGEETLLIGSYITAPDTGKIRIDDISAGDYYFVEVRGLEGYEVNQTEYHFSVNDDVPDGTVIPITAVNRKIPDTPKTGDPNKLYCILALAVGCMIFAGIMFQRKRRKKDE